MTRCMIAGLPSSGKSTYIGALWYCLRHHAKNAKLKMVADTNNLPEDISVLNKLSDAYKNIKPINRTNSNSNEQVQINLKVVETGESIQVEVPDFLGEIFRDLVVLKVSEQLNNWVANTDSLVYFISDVSVGEFEDDFGAEDDDEELQTTDIPPFKITDISPAAMNIMVLKYLLEKKNFRNVVIVLSQWDKQTQNGKDAKDPKEYLKEESPALYHFIEHNIHNAHIIGLSAQGCEYPQVDETDDYEGVKRDIRRQTSDGKRSFVEVGDDIIYDLSIPLYLLLKE